MSEIKTSHVYCRYTFCAVITHGNWEQTIYSNASSSLDKRVDRIVRERTRYAPNEQVDVSFFRWDRTARKWKHLNSRAEIVLQGGEALASGETA